MTHRLQSRNALEFLSFPLPDSGQEVGMFRLPNVLAEDMSPNAHAATCVFQPSSVDDEVHTYNLSPAFVMTLTGVDTPPLPNPPVITHSPGTNQSVAKLRGVEVQLRNLNQTADNVNILTITIDQGAGETTTAVIRATEPGQCSRLVLTTSRNVTLTKIMLQTTRMTGCEIAVLAIGDYP